MSEQAVGYHAYRLTPEQNNPREVAFAEQWDREHKYTDILAHLVCLEPNPERNAVSVSIGTPMRQAREISESERKAVATVIQWLGSNVGMSFLGAALQRCGYGLTFPTHTYAAHPPEPVKEWRVAWEYRSFDGTLTPLHQVYDSPERCKFLMEEMRGNPNYFNIRIQSRTAPDGEWINE